MKAIERGSSDVNIDAQGVGAPSSIHGATPGRAPGPGYATDGYQATGPPNKYPGMIPQSMATKSDQTSMKTQPKAKKKTSGIGTPSLMNSTDPRETRLLQK